MLNVTLTITLAQLRDMISQVGEEPTFALIGSFYTRCRDAGIPVASTPPARVPNVSPSAPATPPPAPVIGPFESCYLRLSGNSRMRHSRTDISREACALAFIREKYAFALTPSGTIKPEFAGTVAPATTAPASEGETVYDSAQESESLPAPETVDLAAVYAAPYDPATVAAGE